jgi:NADPH-dependent 2,4-dienoyl-CoA reductase/sulfur reductase-like enzyme
VILDPGVISDSRCFAVGVDDVVCAGDVAHFPHPLAGGELIRIEHWTNAAKMAQTAGENLVAAAADQREYMEVPSFWSDQYGLKVQSAGFPTLSEVVDVVEGSFDERRFVALGYRGGQLISAIAMNSPRRLSHFAASLRQDGSKATKEDNLLL